MNTQKTLCKKMEEKSVLQSFREFSGASDETIYHEEDKKIVTNNRESRPDACIKIGNYWYILEETTLGNEDEYKEATYAGSIATVRLIEMNYFGMFPLRLAKKEKKDYTHVRVQLEKNKGIQVQGLILLMSVPRWIFHNQKNYDTLKEDIDSHKMLNNKLSTGSKFDQVFFCMDFQPAPGDERKYHFLKVF